jgi:hypothetical protein
MLSVVKRIKRGDEVPIEQLVRAVKRQVEGYCEDDDLVASVARLIPGRDKGDKRSAYQFLADLQRRCPQSARLSNRKLLAAISKARKRNSLDLGREIRVVGAVVPLRSTMPGSATTCLVTSILHFPVDIWYNSTSR